jgi:inorganic pyrophosphatase
MGKNYLCIFLIIPLIAFWNGCSNKQMRNFNAIPSFAGGNVNAVIEIPAGTNRMVYYNEDQRMFLVDQEDGTDRVIDFLPFPGNFGFVPGTFIDPVMGGNGDPVNILVLSESTSTGTVMEVIPLLVLYFEDGSDSSTRLTNPKIIAVPASEKLRIIDADNYEDLFDNYPDLVDILVKWFTSYKGAGMMELRAMGDGEVALNEIEKWTVRRF